MRKINPSLQFLLPKKPFLQGHTSVNAVNGTSVARRKEVWSTLSSWVFRIFFCSLEAGMQTWPIHWPQQHQEKLLLYPFQHFSDKCNGIALFFIWPHNQILYQDYCLHSLGNLVVSFSLCGCTMKHIYSYSLNYFLINSNCIVTFSSHNMQLQAEETIVTALWINSHQNFHQTYEGWKSNIFLVHSVCSRLIEREKAPNDIIFSIKGEHWRKKN